MGKSSGAFSDRARRYLQTFTLVANELAKSHGNRANIKSGAEYYGRVVERPLKPASQADDDCFVKVEITPMDAKGKAERPVIAYGFFGPLINHDDFARMARPRLDNLFRWDYSLGSARGKSTGQTWEESAPGRDENHSAYRYKLLEILKVS